MDSNFLMRRIHSLTGIFPVGLFLVYHLYIQLFLHKGAEGYNSHVNAFYDHPLAILALIIFVYIPLFYHSILGVKMSFEAQVQPQYQYFQHVLYWLQRLSGVGVFLFIFAHLANTQVIPLMQGEWGKHYEHLEYGFHHPQTGWLTISVYILGILGATFHLANGINTFCITWGIALTPKSQARVRLLSILVFLGLAAMSLYAISVLFFK